MAIITYPLNGIDYDAENAETYLCTRTSGVYSADGNFQASVTGDRQVTISTGLAWIQNATARGKSVYVSEPVAVTIPMADGTRDRLDRIVLRFDKAANRSEIVLKQGEPSSAAVAPSVERTELVYELGLCTVLCKAGSTLVDIGDVTSTLLDESVCGLMRDGVTGIPTAQLQEQAEALIDELREVIAGVEDGSEYMLKTVYEPMIQRSLSGVSVVLPASGWTGEEAPYSQTVTVEGMTADRLFASPTSGDDSKGILAVNEALGLLCAAESAQGAVTVYATEKPEIDLTVILRG